MNIVRSPLAFLIAAAAVFAVCALAGLDASLLDRFASWLPSNNRLTAIGFGNLSAMLLAVESLRLTTRAAVTQKEDCGWIDDRSFVMGWSAILVAAVCACFGGMIAVALGPVSDRFADVAGHLDIVAYFVTFPVTVGWAIYTADRWSKR